MNDAWRYERWFDTPFGRRADRVEKRILSDLLSSFENPVSLLEVGCGTGHFVEWWSKHGMCPTGLDTDVGRLEFLRAHHAGVPVVLGDGLTLPFVSSSFDVVALVTVLEFMRSPDLAIREAGRVARRGILLGCLNGMSPVMWWRKARGAPAYRHARFFSTWELEQLVRRSIVDRRTTVRKKTGLYPLGWMDGLSVLPFGAFIGASVCFQ